MFKQNKIVISLAFIFGVVSLSFGLNYAVLAWTEPTLVPPNCSSGAPGCDAPLNVSSMAQIKKGSMLINDDGAALTGLIVRRDAYFLNGNVGIGLSTPPSSKLQVRDGSVLFDGVIGGTPVSGAGTRMMWVPAKAAFRAGSVAGGEWDNANIGQNSVALGKNATASRLSSVAIGTDVFATGNYSIAIGYTSMPGFGLDTEARGFSSIAIGTQARAFGDYSTVLGGLNSRATGEYSNVFGGIDVQAAGQYSTVIGSNINISNTGTRSIGIGLGLGAPTTITQSNTMAIMGGSVGIGTVSPQKALNIKGRDGLLIEGLVAPVAEENATLRLRTVNDGAHAQILFEDSAGVAQASIESHPFDTTANGGLQFVSNNAKPMDFWLNGASRMNILANGDVGIGMTPDERLTVNGTVKATEFIPPSDIRLKENIQPVNNALNKIMKLNGVTFNWKENKEKSMGVIAQDVEKVFPEIVETGKISGMKGVNYDGLIAPLIESIKELKAENNALKARIEALENK